MPMGDGGVGSGDVSATACEHRRPRDAERPYCNDMRSLLDCSGFARDGIGGPRPGSARVLDVDGDGREDLLLQGDGAPFVRLSGPAGLTAGCSQELGIDVAIDALVFGDLDGDNAPDAVDGELSFYLGDGSGQLGSGVGFDAAALGVQGLGTAALGDFDSDGADELLVTAREASGEERDLLLVLALEGGALVERARLAAPMVDGVRITLDADGDGDVDVVSIGEASADDVSLVVDMAVFQGGIPQSVATSAFPQLTPEGPSVIADDYDLDRRAELILAAGQLDSDTSGLLVLKGAPGGTFLQVSFLPGAVTGVFTGGRTEDCMRRFVITLDGASVSFVEVDSGLQLTLANEWTANGAAALLAAADFDGNGQPELAGSGGGDDGLSVWETTSCPTR